MEKEIPEVVSSAASRLTKAGIPMHSLLVAKSSELIAEIYWKPFRKDTLHRMYSCTKSFVSLAIGTLLGQWKLSLDDRIINYFPDMLPSAVPEELASMTIRDMLMMRTCYSKTTYKKGGKPNHVASWQHDWIRSFFTAEPDHDPGAFFIYDTSATHVLASLVERISGMDFMSFIKSTYLKNLDIDERAYILKDPTGAPIGGSGLMMRPADLLKTINGVMHKTLPYIPDWYIEEAVSNLSETEITATDADLKLGYGYQFWRTGDNSWGMYGLGGQFAIAFPDKDIAIVTTADTQADKSMNAEILSAVHEIAEDLDEDTAEPVHLSIPVSRGMDSEEGRQILEGRSFIFSKENSTGIERISFSFSDDGGNVTITRDNTIFSFDFGFGFSKKNIFPVSICSPCYASGGFLPDKSFSLLVQLCGEELGSIKLHASAKGNTLSLMMHLYGELSIDGFEGTAKGIGC